MLARHRSLLSVLVIIFASAHASLAWAGKANVARQSSVSSCGSGAHAGSSSNGNTANPGNDEAHLRALAHATQFEDEVLRLVNEARSQWTQCGAYGRFAPTRPLTMHPLLRCAARKHAQDMAMRQYFAHHTPEGQSPWSRMRDAGYDSYRFAAENIAVGSERPRQVVERLMQDPPHCVNIMSHDFAHIGIGYEPGPALTETLDAEETYRHLTVQDFATPP